MTFVEWWTLSVSVLSCAISAYVFKLSRDAHDRTTRVIYERDDALSRLMRIEAEARAFRFALERAGFSVEVVHGDSGANITIEYSGVVPKDAVH